MSDPYALAREQAERLSADLDIPVDILAEAIWLRTLAIGSPSEAEVRQYAERTGYWVSQRPHEAQPIRPVETYIAPDGTRIVIQHSGRRQWSARAVGAPRPLCYGRTRSIIRRDLEQRYPGGTWTYQLSQRDAAEIRKRWGP